MENRVRLKILGISYSQLQQGVYALILAEVKGPRRIPVVIGAAEAQSIAIKLEGIIPPRPMTHDLFVSFAHAFGVTLREVFIYKFEDGIFSSELTFSDGSRQVVLDSRTSDAIAIAIRYKAPIYTTPEILEETSFIMEGQETQTDDSTDDNDVDPEATEQLFSRQPRIENFTIEELERTLEELIDSEKYEEAAHVSRILDRKRRERDNNDNTLNQSTK